MRPIRGMLLPIPTVFERDGSVDEPVMRELVEFYVNAKVQALFVNGSFGQGAALNPQERSRVAQLVIDHVRGRLPVIVHAGAVDPYTSIAIGRDALEKGADGIGLVGPYYYADRNPGELRLHFKMVGDALKAPTLIYNNPRYQGYSISPTLMSQIVADSPQVFGAKLAMGSIDEAVIYCNAVGVGDAFGTYGLASSLFPGMLNDTGIVGTVSPPLAVAPELGVALVEAIDAGDYDHALALQQAVNDLHAESLYGLLTYGRSSFLPALQEAGFAVKMYPRWPVPPLPEAEVERFRQSVRNARKAVSDLVLNRAKPTPVRAAVA